MAAINKRGDYWRAQVRRKGHDARAATFDTKVQAEAWARSIENAMDKGVYIDNSEAMRTTLLAVKFRLFINPFNKEFRRLFSPIF